MKNDDRLRQRTKRQKSSSRKWILSCIIILFYLFSSPIFAQKTSVNIDKNEQVTVDYVFNLIKQQTPYRFMYKADIFKNAPKVGIRKGNISVRELLNKTIPPEKYTIVFNGYSIYISQKETLNKENKSNRRITLTGTVKESNGATMPGATVYITKEQYSNEAQIPKDIIANAVITDLDGNFVVDANLGQYLVIKSIGFIPYSTSINGNRNNFDITLQVNVKTLSDVFVTGYQTISQERATGAFTKIGADELKNRAVTNISDALNGLTTGINIVKGSDGANRFVIRGVGTFQGQKDQDPLIIVDGFPILGNSEGKNYGGERDPFESINPNDVESITILKDAAATSIYGSKAGNGVIVITTKKAKLNEKLNISFNTQFSTRSIGDLDYAFDLANGASTIKYLENLEKYSGEYNNSWRNPYNSPSDPFMYLPKASELLFEYKRKKNISEAQYNDGINKLLSQEGVWKEQYEKYILRKSFSENYDLSIRGANQTNCYSFSAAYNRVKGNSIGDESKRLILNLNQDFFLSKKLTLGIGANAQISNFDHNGVSLSSLKSFTTPFTNLFNDDGTYAHIAATGTMYEPILRNQFGDKVATSWDYNPLKDRDEKTNKTNLFNIRFQSSLLYKFTEGLSINLKGQYERNAYKNKRTDSPNSYYVRDLTNRFSKINNSTGKYESFFPAGGIFTENSDTYTSYNLRAQLDYSKTIKEKHEIKLVAGAEILSATQDLDPQYTRYGYNEKTNAVQTYPDYTSKVTNIFGTSVYYPYSGLGSLNTIEDRTLSSFGIIGYNYDSKYSFTCSLRADAANYISDEVKNKFSPFWSVGASWNVSKEKFMNSIRWIDYLKFRASYGIEGVSAGKQQVSTMSTLSLGTPSIITTNNEPYATIYLKGNPTLTWEKKKSANIGIDFNLLKSKIYGTLELYNRFSYDVLANATTPFIAQSSTSSVYNNAEISNKGIELALGSSLSISKKIKWNSNINFTYNQNRVVTYNVTPTTPGGSYVPGRPLGCVYAYKLVGYTPEGYPKLEAKDGTIETVTSRATSHLYDPLKIGENSDSGKYLRYYGTTIAPYILGFNNKFEFYNFSLRFSIQGKFGHIFRRADGPSDNQTSPGYSHTLENAFANDANGYVGDYSEMPLLNDKNQNVFNTGSAYMYIRNLHYSSSALIEKADHIRFSDIYLSYNVPNHFFSKKHLSIKGCRIFAQVENLGIIWAANKKGIDPEYMRGSLKPAATWTAGLNINF